MSVKFAEDKAWFSTAKGMLPNSNSYAAMGAFGTAALAYELAGPEHRGLEDLRRLDEILIGIVADLECEFAVDGSTSLQSGLNTRMRGVVRTVIEVSQPIPADPEQWAEWGARVRHEAYLVATVAAESMVASLPALMRAAA